MKFGFVLPGGDANLAAELAQAAEQAAWDGFFMWEPVWGIDPWVSLAAAAMRTQKIRLGTMLTPVSRRRPWKLASETVTLDRLSRGRLILSVGLGAVDTGFDNFGEETNLRKRAELLDEGLAILTGLWAGQPFSFSGQHYQVRETDFLPPPPPVQQPRIPIWVVGAWPRPKSMRRALKYDGILPMVKDEKGTRQAQPEHVAAIKAYIEDNRELDTPFDIVVEGQTPGDDLQKAANLVSPMQDAGATWWIETLWDHTESIWQPGGLERVRRRLSQGPPRIP
jgi:alkanesulfonate monooxygenase SsuD/methylene tetrahydromethanopterin reductase-like flavin-dependent oxidoreductase (luciferase family)